MVNYYYQVKFRYILALAGHIKFFILIISSISEVQRCDFSHFPLVQGAQIEQTYLKQISVLTGIYTQTSQHSIFKAVLNQNENSF